MMPRAPGREGLGGATAISSASVAQVAPHAQLITNLVPLGATDRLAGPAFPCACAPRDNLALHYALMQAPKGSVIVCSAESNADGGYFGELMTIDAMERGIAGLVIDGSVRDTAAIRQLGFPVFARSANPFPCLKRTALSVGDPITIGRATVTTGDVVVADADGVIVVPARGWSDVETAAMELQVAEDRIRRGIQAGTPLAVHLSLPATTPGGSSAT